MPGGEADEVTTQWRAGRSTIAGGLLRMAIEDLASHEIDGPRVAREVGIDPTTLGSERVPTATAVEFFTRVAQIAPSPTMLQVDTVRAASLSALGVFGYALRSSRTIHDALERAVRFSDVVNTNWQARIETDQQMTLVSWDTGLREASHPTAVDMAVLMIAQLGWSLRAPRPVRPMLVTLGRQELRPTLDPTPIARALEAPVELADGAVWTCRWCTRDIGQQLPFYDVRLLAALDRVGEQSVRELSSSFVAKVSAAIEAEMSNGAVSEAGVASMLSVSPRTLRRQLVAEGTSFRELLREARSTISRELVANSRHSLREVAFLLGYSDVASFSRAFKSWHGMPPSDLRRLTRRR